MLPGLFAVTLFIGAALLFLVQPLVGKLLLPLVGGSPGVWNTCMVFFQAVLLAGYLYAHRSTGKLGVRRQAVAHLALLAVVVLAFQIAYMRTGSPIPVATSLLPDDQDYPIFGLVALLTVAVGVPFFVLSTTSPLLQRWFAATNHPTARDPYFLYAASNAGSLLGLLGYPFLIEPRLTLAEQKLMFAWGVVGYAGLVVACAAVVLRTASSTAECGTRNAAAQTAKQPAIPGARIARWVFLAALPSGLLLGVTTHISDDVAPVPLLWAVPLALYLVSFILVFARWSDRTHHFVGQVTPVLLLCAAITLLLGATEPMELIGTLHLAAFFGVCLVCHGELAKDRPPPEQLTAFYFWMSVGGVIGGIISGLVAPVLFHRVGMVEYPLALILAAAVRPRSAESEEGRGLRRADVALALGLFAVALLLVLVVPYYFRLPDREDDPAVTTARMTRGALMFALPAIGALAVIRRPKRFALALAALFAAGAFEPGLGGETLHMERNFYGVVRVTRSPDGKFVRLVHGTAIHGQQRTDEQYPRPMTYYYEWGPVGRLFDDNLAKRETPVKRVGVVGLGIGAVAFYAKPGQHWTFFELDPAVARIAQNPAYFRFLHCCKAEWDVTLGDARRQLTRCPDAEFDLIILDGVCSDAKPVHLLTREAMSVYLQKLRPDGVLAINVTNPHLDLPPLIASTAATFDPPLFVRYRHDMPSDPDRADGKAESEWMLLCRTNAGLGSAEWDSYWDLVKVEPDGPVWHDDFADFLRIWKTRNGR